MDSEGKEAKLFTFKGIVFRGDNRPPKVIQKAGGFRSKNNLSDPSYPNNHYDGGRLYIIDSTKLDPGNQPYYMKDVLLKNKYKKTDESGGEVNITNVPYKAIIGLVKFDYQIPSESTFEEQKKWLKTRLEGTNESLSKHVHVEFNRAYKP